MKDLARFYTEGGGGDYTLNMASCSKSAIVAGKSILRGTKYNKYMYTVISRSTVDN